MISQIYNSENDGLSMLVRGIFYGKPEEAKCIIAEFLTLDNAKYNIEYMTFLEAVSIIGSSYPPYEKFKSASRFVLKDFNKKQIHKIAALITNRPKGSVFAGISMYALGGRVSKVSVDDTAFFYRNAKYIIWLETIWEQSIYRDDNIEWIRSRFSYLESVTKGSYVNFPYSGLEDYLEEYYGCHVKALINIKNKYDPHNIFTFPQGIKKAAELCKSPSIASAQKVIDDGEILKQKDDSYYRGFRYVQLAKGDGLPVM